MAMISTKKAMEKLENFRNMRAIMLFIPKTKELLWVKPTDTGDNLLHEDIEAGFNDYIYCEHQLFNEREECFSEMTDEDAPMYYFNNEDDDYNNDVALAVIPTLNGHRTEISSEEYVEDFIPLFGIPVKSTFTVKIYYDGEYNILHAYADSKETAVDAVFERYNLNKNAEYRVLDIIEGEYRYDV